MAQCDALLIVGSTFPYVEYYPKPGQARVVQIDRDPQRIGLRQPVEAGLVGDARAALEMLNAQLRKKQDRGFLEWRRPRRAAGTTLRAAEAERPAADEPPVPSRDSVRGCPPDAVVAWR